MVNPRHAICEHPRLRILRRIYPLFANLIDDTPTNPWDQVPTVAYLGAPAVLAATCAQALTRLQGMYTPLRESMYSIAQGIRVFARRREEPTIARNEMSFSIPQLMSANHFARKKCRQVSEDIDATTCIENLLQKQEQFVTTT